MKTPIGRSGVSHEDLQLYFDGELTGAEAQELAAQIEAEPELARELEQLGVLRDVVVASLEAKAQEVPSARFEQIWDEIDRALEREARAKESAAPQASIWGRLWTALRPLRMPALATLGAAAVALVAIRVGGVGDETTNNPDRVASVPDAEVVPTPATQGPVEVPEPDKVAVVPPPEEQAPMAFPAPRPAEAEIHEVDFGGRTGRITRTGTVTVLYVEEDQEPTDTERSL